MHLVSVAFAGMVAAGLSAQCTRPLPPPGGFALDTTLTVPVTYSDGYESFATMLVPDTVAPSCGWPVVVYVHPLGSTRLHQQELRELIAQQGFAVWSYDVRGQGQAFLANPSHSNKGSTLWGPVERHDLAEQVAALAADPTWSGIVDTTRLAVIGTSQGAAHSWQAAAWSGLQMQTPGRTPMSFPIVSCVAPHSLVACCADDWLPAGGQLFQSFFLAVVSGEYAALPLDSAFAQQCRDAFVAQDPVALADAWALDERDIRGELALSTVPVFYGHAYHDIIASPLAGIERLETMAGVVRSHLSTIGHATPPNTLEIDVHRNLLLRWLLRYLWAIDNEVDLEPPHALAMLPLSSADREDPAYAWSHATSDGLSVPASAERYYLHDDSTLQSVLPVATAVGATIAHVVDPMATDFDPGNYFDDPAVRELTNVLAACPLSEAVWSLAAPGNVELTRSAAVHLELVPHTAAWTVAALLTVEPVGGEEVMIGSGAVASRDSTPGVAETHELRLPPVAVQIPAGATVRLRLRNLWLREGPAERSLAAAPMFADFDVDVMLGASGAGSWLDLPIRPTGPRLVVDRHAVDLAAMQPITAELRGGIDHADDPYFAVVGLSGRVPGTAYLGETIPVDDDWLVVASAASSSTFFTGFIGFLDADGNAECAVDFSQAAPLPQALNGHNLTLAAFVWDHNWAMTGDPTDAQDVMLR